MTTMLETRRGFTVVEMLIVIAMVGIMAAIVIPRFRVTPQTQVRLAAQQLARDLEFTRTRALGARSAARVTLDAATMSYAGYLDFDRNSTFAQSAEEADSLGGFRFRTFEHDVEFGRGGGVPDLPLLPGAGAITLPNARVEFDTRGLTMPFGTRGVIYLSHATDPNAAAAVSISGGAGIRAWVYQEGAWR
jgi:prepilin-type N-terminal cleavage/methylation domain-containing protein